MYQELGFYQRPSKYYFTSKPLGSLGREEQNTSSITLLS